MIRFLKLQFALLAELVYVADYSSGDEEESVYETLSDSVCNISVNPPSDLDLLRPDDSNLSKIAEAAGRGIKKLRRNWSIKKDDLSKGLSKIKRSSRNLIEDVYTKEGNKPILVHAMSLMLTFDTLQQSSVRWEEGSCPCPNFCQQQTIVRPRRFRDLTFISD